MDIVAELDKLEAKWDERSEGWSEGARESCSYGTDEKADHDRCMAAMNAINACINDIRALRIELELIARATEMDRLEVTKLTAFCAERCGPEWINRSCVDWAIAEIQALRTQVGQ